MTGDDLRDFVNGKLFPRLHGFKQRASRPDTIEYKIGEIFGEIKNRIMRMTPRAKYHAFPKPWEPPANLARHVLNPGETSLGTIRVVAGREATSARVSGWHRMACGSTPGIQNHPPNR
jgi:hypothetical protein